MTVDTGRFCGSCGAAREPTAIRFCRQCGTPFGAATPVAPAAPAASLEGARRRPYVLVTYLGFFGSSAYAFFWLWMSWRELKRIRADASMYPFWHAVAAFFPLFGLAAVHAHFRRIDQLAAAAGVSARAGATLLTLVFALLTAALYGSIALALASNGMPTSLAPISLLIIGAAYAHVVQAGQIALNAFYVSLPGAAVPQRGRLFEYVFLAIFVLVFLGQMFIALSSALPK